MKLLSTMLLRTVIFFLEQLNVLDPDRSSTCLSKAKLSKTCTASVRLKAARFVFAQAKSSLVSTSPSQDPPARSRRKSDGDEAPKRKTGTPVPKRRVSLNDSASGLSTSSRGAASEPQSAPGSGVSSGGLSGTALTRLNEPPAKETLASKSVAEEKGKAASSGGSDVSSGTLEDVSTSTPSGSQGEAPTSVAGSSSVPVSGLRKSGTAEAERAGKSGDQPGVLIARGSNRPSTPSPFAIVSKKEDDAARKAGIVGVARSLFGASEESGAPQGKESGSDELVEWIQGDGRKAGSTGSERVRKWGGATAAEGAPPERTNSKESRESVSRDKAKELNPSMMSAEIARSKLPIAEASAEPVSSAGPAELASDVTLTHDALTSGQHAERRLKQECAAVMEWLGFSLEALVRC